MDEEWMKSRWNRSLFTPDYSNDVRELPKDNTLKVKGILNDACGGYSHSEDILLGGHVARVSNTIQCI